jgi:hypothetical protein
MVARQASMIYPNLAGDATRRGNSKQARKIAPRFARQADEEMK